MLKVLDSKRLLMQLFIFGLTISKYLLYKKLLLVLELHVLNVDSLLHLHSLLH